LFKSWQVFVFSLVPLALVFAGVIIGSMHGLDSERQVYPTAAPTEANSAPAATAVPGATQVTLVASNLAFDKSSITAKAGEPVSITFDNKDAGVLHNVSVYTDRTAKQAIFQGDLTTGPAETTYTFDAPSTPGSFYFHCDVHPDTMQGTLVVQ
jgi:plastocyanin